MTRSNEWGESLQQTIYRSKAQRGLLVYSMVAGEEITVGISGHIAGDIEVDESRIIKALSVGTSAGALEVIEDTAETDNWQGRVICLGSFAYNISNVDFSSPGLLRGFIGADQGVAVDLSGEHFTGSSDPGYMLAQYKTLDLEGQPIF